MAKIDVIIPVYNVERHLQGCIRSVLGQTFRDFRIILVDDGSTDRSGKICDAYGEKYGCIQVIHKENGGASDARNRGLEASESEYLAFVDSDDRIDRRYLEILYGMIRNYHADLAVCHSQDIPDPLCGGGKRGRKSLPDAWKRGREGGFPEAEVISRAEAYKRMFTVDGMSVTACAKLYHRRLFQGVRFPAGEICEDAYIINQTVENSSRIVCTRYGGYYYVRRKGSSWHQGMTPMHRVAVRNARRLWDFTKENYPEIEDAAKVFYYNNCIQLINFMIVGSGEGYEEDCRKLRREILKGSRFFLRSRYTGPVEKGAVLCLMPGLFWYRLAWRAYLRLTGKHAGTMT